MQVMNIHNWDKIAKTGTFTDMNGNTFTFTRKRLERIADKYKLRKELAPVVFGHPQTNSPALGWVAELRVNGDLLEARYDNLKNSAKNAVLNDEYRYKSMSITPESDELVHVGWLGGVAPAMSGLGEISFSKEDKCITLYFSEQDNNNGEESMNEETRRLLEAKEAQITELLAKIAELTKENDEVVEEVQEVKQEIEEIKKEAEEADKKIEETEAAFAKYRTDVVTAQRTSRIDALVAGGKIIPAERDKALIIATALGASATASFAGADGKSITAEEQYLKDLEGRPETALFSKFSEPVTSNAATSVNIAKKL